MHPKFNPHFLFSRMKLYYVHNLCAVFLLSFCPTSCVTERSLIDIFNIYLVSDVTTGPPNFAIHSHKYASNELILAPFDRRILEEVPIRIGIPHVHALQMNMASKYKFNTNEVQWCN